MYDKPNLTDKLIALSLTVIPTVLFLISGATGFPAILGVAAFIVIGILAVLFSSEESRRRT